MRTLLAFAFIIGGVLTLDATAADTARKTKQSVPKRTTKAPSRDATKCEQIAEGAGRPCWAGEALTAKPGGM